MLQSMTGFGRAKKAESDYHLQVEMKSVNNRFLDVQCKLPGVYSELEQKIVSLVRQSLQRGRVEILVLRKSEAAQPLELRINHDLLVSTVKEIASLKKKGVSEDVVEALTADALGRREVMEYVAQEQNVESEFDAVLEVVADALAGLQSMRSKEGKALYKEIERILTLFVAACDKIKTCAKSQSKEINKRIQDRVSELLDSAELDETRLYQEVAILADKADITEELTRIDSHLEQFRETIAKGSGGRKLEFLLQELGREINTCGSKSQDVEISRSVVDAKACLEKLREQVLNVE